MNQKTYFQKHLLKNAASGFDPRVETHWRDDEESLNYGKREDWQGQEHVDERQVFPNEVVIDIDAPDKETAKQETEKVKTILEGQGVPLLVADTGGTGFHIHIFFRYEGLDHWEDYREYRITLFEFFKALCEEQKNGPNTELWDEGLVEFDLSLNREGHLVRALGGRKIETERFKTTVSTIKKEDVKESEKVEYPVKIQHMELAKFSEKQGLFTLKEVQDKVEEIREKENERRKEDFDISDLSEEAGSLQELRDLPAHEVLKLIGVDTEPGEMLQCPFHDDKNPSAKVTDGTESGEIPEGVFLCFADSCLEEEDHRSHRYNAIDILTENGRTFREAIRELIQEFDLDIEESDVLESGSSNDSKGKLSEVESERIVVTDGDTETLSEAFPDSEVLFVDKVQWSEEEGQEYEKFRRSIVALDSLKPSTWEAFLKFHSKTEARPELDFLPLHELDDLEDTENELRGENYLMEKAGEGDRRQRGNVFDLLAALHFDSKEVIRDSVASELKEETGLKKSAIEKTLKEKKKDLQESEDDEDITVDGILEVAEDYNFVKNDWSGLYALIGEENPRLVKVETKGESGSQDFQRSLKAKLKEKYGHIPKNGKVKNAIDLIVHEKMDELPQIQFKPRIDKIDGNIVYDLSNGNREAIEISPEGWKEVEKPIHMKTFNHMKPQVEPVKNGEHTLDDFIDLLNPELAEDMKMLLKVQVVANFYPGLNHPIIYFQGPPGSGKSTAHRLIRELVDPSTQATGINLKGDEEEDAIKFYKHYMPVFDNLSKIEQETSDLLCKAVTGGYLSKRKLYTDMETVEFSFHRPIGLNSLQNLTAQNRTRDLAERSMVYEFPKISPENRKRERDPRNNEEKVRRIVENSDISEDEVVAEEAILDSMEEIKPSVLGHIFDILSEAMVKQFTTQVPDQYAHRLKDFQEFGEAVAQVLGYPEGKFSRKFKKVSEENQMEAEDTSSLVKAVLRLLEDKDAVEEKRATELLQELERVADRENIEKDDDFPSSNRKVKQYIERKEDVLNHNGIAYETEKKGGYRRHTLRWDASVTQKSESSLMPSELRGYLNDELERHDDTVQKEKILRELEVEEEEFDEAMAELARQGEFVEIRSEEYGRGNQ